MIKSFIAVSALALSFSACAVPKISVGSMYEFIDDGKSTLLKRVRNSGDSTAFVRVEVSEVSWNKEGKKQERKIDAKAAATSQIDGLIYSPSRMIIPAKGMQSGRLIMTGNRQQERYFQVRFIPVMPKDKSEFGQSQQDFNSYKKLNAGFHVLTGFGAMVIVRPLQVRYSTTIDETAQQIVIKNHGNTSVLLDDVKLCAKEKCSETLSTILLPGKSYSLRKENNKRWQFKLLEGSKTTLKKFG